MAKATKAPAAKAKKEPLKVFKSDALELLKLLGQPVTKKTSNEDLSAYFDNEFGDLCDSNIGEDDDVDAATEKLMKKITEATEKEIEVTVVDDDEEEAGDTEAAESDEEESDDEEGGEEADDEEEAPAPKKGGKAAPPAKVAKKPAKKEVVDGPGRGRPAGDKKVGIIQTIVQVLVGASAKKPVTKADILAILDRKFNKNNERPNMKATVNMQVPTGLKTEKNLTVSSNDKGYWLESTPRIEQYIETGSMKDRAPAKEKPKAKEAPAAKPGKVTVPVKKPAPAPAAKANPKKK